MIIDVLEQWRVWQHRSIGYVLPYPRAIRPRVLILQLGSSNSKSPRNGFRCVRGLTIITSSNVVTNLLIQATGGVTWWKPFFQSAISFERTISLQNPFSCVLKWPCKVPQGV